MKPACRGCKSWQRELTQWTVVAQNARPRWQLPGWQPWLMSPHLVGCLLELPCLTYKMVAAKRGLLVTMENPKTSYFWITKWVMGGDRYKWTEISQMDIRCNRQHQAAWGFAKKTWATSQESQYRKKMGVCLGQTVLQRLCKQDLTFQATLEHIADHPLKAACCERKLLLAFCGKSCRL